MVGASQRNTANLLSLSAPTPPPGQAATGWHPPPTPVELTLPYWAQHGTRGLLGQKGLVFHLVELLGQVPGVGGRETFRRGSSSGGIGLCQGQARDGGGRGTGTPQPSLAEHEAPSGQAQSRPAPKVISHLPLVPSQRTPRTQKRPTRLGPACPVTPVLHLRDQFQVTPLLQPGLGPLGSGWASPRPQMKAAGRSASHLHAWPQALGPSVS